VAAPDRTQQVVVGAVIGLVVAGLLTLFPDEVRELTSANAPLDQAALAPVPPTVHDGGAGAAATGAGGARWARRGLIDPRKRARYLIHSARIRYSWAFTPASRLPESPGEPTESPCSRS
jgi:hypothetical protein